MEDTKVAVTIANHIPSNNFWVTLRVMLGGQRAMG